METMNADSTDLLRRAILLLLATCLLIPAMVNATTFVLSNNCAHDVWPGVLADSGNPMLGGSGPGGFLLPAGQSATLYAVAGWSGRFWGRTGCNFDGAGKGTCLTGDCGGVLACNGAGGDPPVTLAEFTLGSPTSPNKADFYDVSLVDGYNLAMSVAPSGGSGSNCRPAGCTSDLLHDGRCPPQLQVTATEPSSSQPQLIACRSACDAFASPEFCCTGDFGSPQTCSPNSYSKAFKSACPTAYSYAYDDPTSTFTCISASSYTITFCPKPQ
ncbi:hypothetical protein KP509_09G091900 [Ceratopteris richardii]|uniref:Thaumatin-like protein n=1 Tax=Ceratopteris richardii TaxID=49495 RepID=A0A8T2U9K6_CERRI|nr:hypothetical protein KP509_09G091900 [Ceratopteris richardii]